VGEPLPTAFASRDVMPPVTVVAQRS
jgi:hypothetical protein